MPPACSSAAPGETDASGALGDRAAPAPYHAEVIVLPAPLDVRPLAEPVTPAALDDTDRGPRSVLAATFESASAGCNGWDAEGADALRSVPARSGDYASRGAPGGDGVARGGRARRGGDGDRARIGAVAKAAECVLVDDVVLALAP